MEERLSIVKLDESLSLAGNIAIDKKADKTAPNFTM
jgi:hypothetical protein